MEWLIEELEKRVRDAASQRKATTARRYFALRDEEARCRAALAWVKLHRHEPPSTREEADAFREVYNAMFFVMRDQPFKIGYHASIGGILNAYREGDVTFEDAEAEIAKIGLGQRAVRVYLAARYSRHPEMQEVARDLQARGFEVTSRWIWGDHQVDNEGLSVEAGREARERFAMEDIEDLRRASICISFSETPRSTNSRGGRHVEHGYALALGMRCIIVGPRENVFHCASGVEVYEDAEAMLGALGHATERA